MVNATGNLLCFVTLENYCKSAFEQSRAIEVVLWTGFLDAEN